MMLYVDLRCSPVAVLASVSTCIVISNPIESLRTSTTTINSSFSLTINVDWLKLTVATENKKYN